MKKLENYYRLIERVDELCADIRQAYKDDMACRKGCDRCCRHITVFPVEAAALAVACDQLPSDLAGYIRGRARISLPDGSCPLLENGECLLYPARPIICRTHGFPILVNGDDQPGVDYCPMNFKTVSSFPAASMIDLDRLNQLLAVINALFIGECMPGTDGAARLTISEALQLPVNPLFYCTEKS